ncbi:MAG: D-hexose-6-phosphate mutarotase [Gammaproteobacteria bacterium]
MNNSLEKLNQQFAIEHSVAIKQNPQSELLYIEIKNKSSTATIQLQGAHLTDWTPVNHKPVIWLSALAKFRPGKSIRGGIPICWPWFGAHQTHTSYPAHGFARTALWEIESTDTVDTGKTQIKLRLPENNIPESQWPFNTAVYCIFTIGKELEIELVTTNNSQEDIIIGEAFHSYFNVSDVSTILISGLSDCRYQDKLDDFTLKNQSGNIDIKQEVDRIYIATDHNCIIEDLGFNRTISIVKKNSLSTVVWNPWLATATKMGDLGDEGYLKMICVESGNATHDVVTLKPEQRHNLYVRYCVDEIN